MEIEGVPTAGCLERFTRAVKKTFSCRPSLAHDQTRTPVRTPLLLIGGAFVGMVVWLSVYAKTTTDAESG